MKLKTDMFITFFLAVMMGVSIFAAGASIITTVVWPIVFLISAATWYSIGERQR